VVAEHGLIGLFPISWWVWEKRGVVVKRRERQRDESWPQGWRAGQAKENPKKEGGRGNQKAWAGDILLSPLIQWKQSHLLNTA